LALRYFVLGIITPKYPLDRFLPEANFDLGWPHFPATVNRVAFFVKKYSFGA
tara:strand:- start:637 stop:792 length:156 start_codon:yes stop_codon:yes gene_type:complete